MLKYESEQCLEGTALSEGLRVVVVVLRWQCPERLLCQCTRLGKLTRLLKDVGTDHLSGQLPSDSTQQTCGNVIPDRLPPEGHIQTVCTQGHFRTWCLIRLVG